MAICLENMVQNIILFLSVKHKPLISDNPLQYIKELCKKIYASNNFGGWRGLLTNKIILINLNSCL